MKISLIVAADENLGIGKDGQLLCYLSEDLAFFKRTTMGHAIIMGRKTHHAIGKALPGRMNIILTRKGSADFISDVQVVQSAEEALLLAEKSEKSEVFVIGGGEIYRVFLPLAHRIFLTRIHHPFPADTFFPHFSKSEWKMIQSRPGVVDEKNAFPHTFETWERI